MAPDKVIAWIVMLAVGIGVLAMHCLNLINYYVYATDYQFL